MEIIAVELPIGFSSILAFNSATGPTITPDGQTVVSGAPFGVDGNAPDYLAAVHVTPLTGFPLDPGPFYASFDLPAGHAPENGRVDDVAAGPDGLYAVRAVVDDMPDELRLVSTSPASVVATRFVTGLGSFSDPALVAKHPQFVLFAQRDFPIFGDDDIASVPLTSDPSGSHFGTPSLLPAVVNTPRDEFEPAVTADGRFVAFVRHGPDGHDRLFLWDSLTQLLLNPDGVDLGAATSLDAGNVSVYTQPVFSIAQVTMSQISQTALANITARIGQGAGLGILVQRIVGRRRILGRREYKLQMVGRVPLGHFNKGIHHLQWNLRVNGKRLRPGRYLVTLRALSNSGVIRDMATPTVVHIR